ncbi:hypothetical protein HYX04_00945 [Candidatus Woesearchaeota archaeon]|nr:hypothetical protein [Candidatus Woesearchaeota archaeon]
MARGDTSYSSHDTHLFEKPAFQYFIVLSIIATLVVSIFALVNTYQLKKVIVPRTVNVNDFLKKLTSHDEMKGYVGVSPLNIIQINNNNFANLQAQISGLDQSYVGNFIVQYTDRIAIYDYDNNKVRGTVGLQQPQQAQLPADFFTKLNSHAELKGLQSQQPIGGQLDSASLDTLKQQFPEVYANAKTGDYLLRYQTKLIIYDYSADKIVNSVNLG